MHITPARIRALRRRLLGWYDHGHRALPWRFPQRQADPYRVWIAEVMLQQTQVQVAIPYYERFVARFPTLKALAAASEDEVLALWSGLGYYARARNLRAAAREALDAHGGLPASTEALRALPGVGPYTAGAVASIAFALPAAAVDGNVLRVLARLFHVRGAPGAARTQARIRALAQELVDGDRPGDLNQALMELGATICRRPTALCARCPVASLCAARAAGRAQAVPPPRRRPERRPLVLACAIVRRASGILVVRRPARGLFGGLWAPPTAEVGAGGDPRHALARALRERHGLRAIVGAEIAACQRSLTHHALMLRAFGCRVARRPPGSARLVFADAKGLGRLGVPTAFRALLARVER